MDSVSGTVLRMIVLTCHKNVNEDRNWLRQYVANRSYTWRLCRFFIVRLFRCVAVHRSVTWCCFRPLRCHGNRRCNRSFHVFVVAVCSTQPLTSSADVNRQKDEHCDWQGSYHTNETVGLAVVAVWHWRIIIPYFKLRVIFILRSVEILEKKLANVGTQLIQYIFTCIYYLFYTSTILAFNR